MLRLLEWLWDKKGMARKDYFVVLSFEYDTRSLRMNASTAGRIHLVQCSPAISSAWRWWKNYVSTESMRTRKAWHGIYKVFLVWLCNILTQTETDWFDLHGNKHLITFNWSSIFVSRSQISKSPCVILARQFVFSWVNKSSRPATDACAAAKSGLKQ